MSKHRLVDASELLETDIKTGILTPFLGAGASSLRSSEIDLASYPWKEVATTLTAVSSRVRGEKECKDFLGSFAEQRLRLPYDKIVPVITPSRKVDPELGEHILIKLQAELVRACVRMTRYFGMRLAEERPSIQSLDECSVDVRLASDEGIQRTARECIQRLLSAADLASELEGQVGKAAESPFLTNVAGATRVLERRQLYRKLLALTVGLIGNHRELYEVELARHRRVGGRLSVPTDVEEGTSPSFGKLRLDAIQWMSDLLWYTVRYWVPWYPTTAELGFELSLVVRDGPPRRADLAQAAQALENRGGLNSDDRAGAKELAARVGSLVTYCETVQERKESPDWQTKAFYYAIAAVVQYQYEKYKASIDAVASQRPLKDRFKASDTAESHAKIPVPLVFTTNFDRALEKVLEDNDLCFHTVFPVLRGEPEDRDSGAPIWMIRTQYPKSEHRTSTTEVWTSICEDTVPRGPFKGPIIVKLHGSPSLPLEDLAQQHWIVLSETGYLDSFCEGFKVPPWLARQLSSQERAGSSMKEAPRSLWFLGYSISDWNVRLRLYEHCNEHRRLRGGRRSTVGRPADVYRTAILGRLEVDQCEGDLNELPYMILQTFYENDLKGSEKVTHLVGEIRNHLPRYSRWKAM